MPFAVGIEDLEGAINEVLQTDVHHSAEHIESGVQDEGH